MLVPEVNDRQASNLIVPFPGSHVAIFHVQPLALSLVRNILQRYVCYSCEEDECYVDWKQDFSYAFPGLTSFFSAAIIFLLAAAGLLLGFIIPSLSILSPVGSFLPGGWSS